MLFKLFCLLVGFICGYLIIGWVPIHTPFILSDYLAEYLFDPIKFLVIMVCFLIGFLVNSILIRSVVEETIQLLSRREINILNILLSYSVLGSFYVLFQLGFWQTLVILCFSLFYGIISIDIDRIKVLERNR